jgi:hypothetical protein
MVHAGEHIDKSGGYLQSKKNQSLERQPPHPLPYPHFPVIFSGKRIIRLKRVLRKTSLPII